MIDEKLKWGSKHEILKIINKYEKSGVIMLSGDVHFAEIYHMNCKSISGYDIHEVTSSGMTHSNSFFGKGAMVIESITHKFWNVRIQ